MLGYTLKSGVYGQPSQAIGYALDVADSLWSDYGYDLVVTSLRDSVHAPNSLHYSGQAADLRTRDMSPAEASAIASALQSTLGSAYWVLNEGDHIHVQSKLVDSPDDTSLMTEDAREPSNAGLLLVGALIIGAIVVSR